MISKGRISDFIDEVKAEKEFDGCWYLWLDNTYALVCAYDYDEDKIVGKIAFNCDDLQCDYDWDWEMPYNPHYKNEIIDTTIDMEDYTPNIVEEVIEIYNIIK